MKKHITQKRTLLIFAILALVCVPQRAVYAAPSFILPATTRTVAENTPPGTNIGAPVSATGTTNLDRYILAETDDHPNDYLSFDIDTLTGQIKTKAPLDYETKTTYKLSVTVQEGEIVNGELVLSNRSNIVVTINVTDVSEAFPLNSATLSIAENTAAGMNIGDPISAEPDTSSPYEYRLVGTDAGHFTLDRLGVGNTSSDNASRSSQLQTKGALDYEAKNSYSVTLQFFTGTWVGLSVTWNASPEDTIAITINIENKNEAPAFSSSTATIQIRESTSANTDIGSPITATDPDITSSNTDANPDTADADTVAYSLSGTADAPNDYESFAIDATTGQLKVAENVDLDYDDKNSYTFTVAASDGTLSGTIEVTVELQDVVHAPLFINDMGETITEASFKIEEDSPPGTDVGYALKVRVDDANATVTYSLSAHDDAPDDSNSFTLNSDGQLKVGDNVRLDFETKIEYKVNVTASDGTHSTTIPVTINVTNIELRFINENGNALSSPTTVHVDEGVPRGTKIAGPYRVNELSEVIFTYEGRSTPENMNDHLSFNREKSSNADGERVWYIIAEEPLDYESKNQYILRMRVQIVGKAESHTVRLIINIRDVNDNRPVFTDGVRATRSIVENTPSGEPVGEPIGATDRDAGTTITYALQAHPDAPSDVDAFTIDTGTGQIKTNASLDYETKKVYLVNVTATDDDPNDPNDTFRTTSIPVTINVTDAVPTFIEADPASRSVAENTARGTDIGNPVSATAPDIGETATYSLVTDTDTSPNYDWFDIDPATGQLKVKGALNYEQKTSYTVVVAVSVNDNTEPSDTITVNISVTNEIEGRPAFRGDSSRSVDENVPIGTPVGIPIEFINLPGTFTYSVTGTDRTAFSIDGNAQLKTDTTLDFEDKSSYSINVNVQWTPVDVVQTESVAITVNVNNKNEAPMFADETTIRTVPTTANDGTSLGAPLTAVDPDIAGDNTDANPETEDSDSLTYTLSGTHVVLFELDSEEPGQLIAKRPSALTAGTTYNVIVTASDGELSDTINVDITATGMPTVLITLPTDAQGDTIPQTGTFDVGIRFSESVTGFAASDITLTLTLTEGSGTATATLVDASAGDMDYTARISLPDNAEGSLVISVPAGVATNDKSTGNTASAEYTVPIDTLHPTYATPSLAGTRTGPFRTTITFSEPVADFAPNKFTTQNCQITELTDLTRERTNYLATITPTASGNASFTIDLNKVHDDAGNGNSNNPQRLVAVALENPNVTISAPTTSQSAPFDITITFSEIVEGFTASDISLGGTATGIVTDLTRTSSYSNGIRYTATIVPSTSGDLEISVPANVAFDDAGNGNNASSTKTVPVTVTGPTVAITDVPTTPQNSAFTITITFSEAVTGFEVGDISLGDNVSATVKSFSGSGTTYTAEIEPADNVEEDVTISVPTGVALNASSVGNNTSPGYTVRLDKVPPSVTITGPPETTATTLFGMPFDVAFEFHEAVTEFDVDDISLGGNATATVDNFMTMSGTTYTATITPSTEGFVLVTALANTAKDAAGNRNAATSSRFSVDPTRPAVTITDLPTAVQTGAFEGTFGFDDPVTGFDADDITLSGTVNATVTLSETSSAVYEVTITPEEDAEGNVTISVAENVAENAVGLGNTALATAVTVPVDTLHPEVRIKNVPAMATMGGFVIAFEFTEAVSGFEMADISLSGTATAALNNFMTESNRKYTANIVPSTTGNLTIFVPADRAVDVADNGNIASSTHTVTITDLDTTPPTVSVTARSTVLDNPQKDNFDVAITFSEPVIGFNAGDISLTLELTEGTGTATTDIREVTRYIAVIKPPDDVEGIIKISVPAGAAKDASNNANTASNELTVRIDRKAPSVEITNVPTTPQNSAFDVKVTFSEAVTDFRTDDISLTHNLTEGTGTATVGLSGDDGDSEYMLTITPPAEVEGEIKISVPANAVVDAGNNGNTVSSEHTVTITDVEVEQPNNAPTFSVTETGTRSIAENTDAGTNIGAAVSATDDDRDTLTYSLKAHTDDADDYQSFDIVSTSGQLKTKTGVTLDYETQSTYKVTVQVSDGTATASIDVTITITNVNEAPAFAAATATRSIAENTDAGTNIGAAVTATDPDGSTDVNPENVNVDALTYSLVNLTSSTDADAFDIDSNSGQIKTKDALNYEVKNSYQFNMQVSDGAETDAITVTITVTNVTGEPPVFPVSTLKAIEEPFKIAENTVADVNIGTPVTAVDDDGDTIEYTLGLLATTNDYLSFAIDSGTGEIKTKEPLDYETQSEYSIDVTAEGAEVQGVNVNITIQITDVNEKPVFPTTETGTRSIAENTAANTNIGDPVAATDPDTADDDADNTDVNPTDENVDALTYSLVNPTSSTDADTFDIVSTSGQIKTKNALDHETKGSYAFKVRVSDGEFNTDIDVIITITDVDETPVPPPNNAPTFSTATATRSVAENTATNTNIGAAVSATDDDSTDTLTYSLVNLTNSTDADAFDINSTDGQLKTKSALNYEAKNSYTFKVQVSDGTATASIDVTINITNVNEAPEFPADTTISFNISESAAGGTVIGTVAAEDPDIAGTNTDVNPDTATADSLTYSLSGTTTASNDYQSFDIENTANGGQLKLKTGTTLDYDTKSAYTVKVTASDGSTNTASIDITINVVEIVSVSITAASAVTANPQNGAFNVTITFSGSVTGFAASDISLTTTLTEGTGSATVSNLTGSGTTYTATITPPANVEGTVKISVPAGAAVDSNSQGNAASSEFTVDIDTKAPGVRITNVPTTTQNSAFTVTITFGEDVTGFAASDITLSGTATASVTSLTGSGTTYIATITPTTNGSVSIQVPADAAEDAAGNGNTQSQSHSVTFTTEASPVATTLEIVSGDGQFGRANQWLSSSLVVVVKDQNGDPFEGATVNFSVDPTDGTLDPTSATTRSNGRAFTTLRLGSTAEIYTVPVSVPGITDTATFTATATSVGYNPIKIVSGNGQSGRAGQQLTNPLVVEVKNQNGDPLVSVTVEFSTSFDPDTGRSFGSVNPTTDATDADGQASTRFRLGSTAGVYTVTASATVINQTYSVTFTANVIGTINRKYNSLGKVTSDPINIHYGESVDITVRVSPFPIKDADVSASYLNFWIGSFAESGALNTRATGLSITSDDTDHKANSATGLATATVAVASDAYIPDLEPNVPGKSFRVMVAFLVDNVNGTRFLSDGTSEGISPDPISFTVRVTEKPETSQAQIRADTDAPGVSVSVPSGVQTGAFDVTITFTETVSDFVKEDLSVSGTASARITAWASHPDNTTYTATITPTTSGKVVLDIAAGVATDAADNPNTASETRTITIEIPSAIPEPSTWMLDANLRTAVQTSLSLAAGETLTQAKMLDLTELKAAGRSISDITGIEHATNLTTARLANNQISSLSPLSDLTTLTKLRLQNNQISDISALSGLTNLTQLFLNDNDITDITPLSGLVNLETLKLSGNPLTNNDANAQTLITLQAAGATIDVPVDNVGGAPTLEKATQLPAPLIPKTSALLPNYPNPFNPETWIPYQLSKPANVTVMIYSMHGIVVREIKLGHQAAGMYRSRSRAAHWDGRNAFGERVANGVYFYTLAAGDFTATRRMLILK